MQEKQQIWFLFFSHDFPNENSNIFLKKYIDYQRITLEILKTNLCLILQMEEIQLRRAISYWKTYKLSKNNTKNIEEKCMLDPAGKSNILLKNISIDYQRMTHKISKINLCLILQIQLGRAISFEKEMSSSRSPDTKFNLRQKWNISQYFQSVCISHKSIHS